MSWRERDSHSVWHPFTPSPFHGTKLLLTSAKGAYVYDDKNNPYYDGTSSWWCQTHGHCHPRLMNALKAQADRFDQVMFAPHTHEVAIELSEKLLQHLGVPFRKVFFSDDGSTAVEAALKIAVQYWAHRGEPHRRNFLSLEQAYHGDTLGAVSVSRSEVFHGGFSSDGPQIPLPVDDFSLQQAREIFETESGEAAALIVEPLILGAAGMKMYPAAGLQALVEMAREKGLLVIFDEVFTGFGRTGTMFAMEQISARPDIVCLSKGLTAGVLPLGATVVTEPIFEAFTGGPEKTFYHGHTYTANALSSAVALESLKMFEDEHTLDAIRPLSTLMAGEQDRFSRLPHVGNVRSRGMVWALDLFLDDKRTPPTPLNAPGWKIAEALLAKGIWIRPLHNTLYLIPPYCTTEAELRDLFSVLYSELQNESHFTN